MSINTKRQALKRCFQNGIRTGTTAIRSQTYDVYDDDKNDYDDDDAADDNDGYVMIQMMMMMISIFIT